MKIEVNGEQIYSNYPQDLEQPVEEQEDYKQLTPEQRVEHLKDESLLKLRLDNYQMPSLLQKFIKSLKKNMVATMTTTRIKDKLHTNFKSDFLDQYTAFKEGDTVKFTVSLFGIQNTSYFYKLSIAEKLAYVTRLKATAGEFFKAGNCKKAAKIYQKINGYYNFGDTGNNWKKEDEGSAEFHHNKFLLDQLKLTSFTNLTVCKFKMKEYQSVIAITDQIKEMAPCHAKALYFRGKAQILVEDFDDGIQTLALL